MYQIKKVINNNALLVADARLQEYVLMGNGIGFGIKETETITDEKVSKKFLLTKDADQENLLDIIVNTDQSVFIALEKMIEVIKKYLSIDYNGYQYYSLLDHLIGTINRVEKGINFKTAFNEEDILMYELELVVADKIARILQEELDLAISKEEIYVFAIHLNNAQNEISFSNLGPETVVILKELLNIVDECLQVNKKSFFYNRFLLHLKFFVLRHLDHFENSNEHSVLYASVSSAHIAESHCVNQISEFLISKYNWAISPDEKLYLLLHLAKLNK